MHDFIVLLAARDRTETTAREALPHSPVRPPDTRRYPVRQRVSATLFRLADWLEPASAKDAPQVGGARPCQPA